MGLRWFISFKSCESIALHYLAGFSFSFLFLSFCVSVEFSLIVVCLEEGCAGEYDLI